MHATTPASPEGRFPCVVAVVLLALRTFNAEGQGLSGPTSDTYSNLAATALLQRAQKVSRALTGSGFLPEESFANASVMLEGESTHPSARVQASCCEYEFRQGLLQTIRRRDLFEDKGPASLILRHLTNEVLTLTVAGATNRALEVLRLLSYPANRIQQVYRFNVHDDMMDAYPVRNGGRNFPRDLHFYGELISRKKIKLMVGLGPIDSTILETPGRTRPETQINFLATTGQLLEAWWLPDSDTMARIGMSGPEPITIRQAADFAPPVFVSATRRLSDGEVTATRIQAAGLVRDAWKDLQQKLGTNRPQCILICDNLNDPTAVANSMKEIARDIPWAGVSHLFRLDLPFEPAQVERLAQGRRGLRLMAICGTGDIRLEVLSGLDAVPPAREEDLATPEGQQEWKQVYEQERQRLAPSIGELIHRLRLPEALPDHALFLLQAKVTWPSSDIIPQLLQSTLPDKAQVISVMGSGDYSRIGEGFTYFNGKVLTNAMAVLSLSGFLPLQQDILHLMALRLASFTNSPNYNPDKLSLLRSRSPRRIVSPEIVNPVRQLAYAFGPHPLEELVEFLGLSEIKMLRGSDKLEVFEIRPDPFDSSSKPGISMIEGYELVTRGDTLDEESAHEFTSALLTDKNGIGVASSCEWQPVIVFRAWRAKEYASLIVCFECNEAAFKFYDGSGKLIHQTHPFLFSERLELLRLARQALPNSAALRKVR
ncbi:MAG TPA: hypothetical protein VG146_19780 [Verrucomicrobiae bacterium]|nr:hypothetical protein [Verrucomicrobiae bacterium]